MLVERGYDHDDRQMSAAQLPHDFKAAHDGHLEVQENQVRLELGDLLQGLLAIFGLADDHTSGTASSSSRNTRRATGSSSTMRVLIARSATPAAVQQLP